MPMHTEGQRDLFAFDSFGGTGTERCPDCGGEYRQTCHECHGTGKAPSGMCEETGKCMHCGGDGIVEL